CRPPRPPAARTGRSEVEARSKPLGLAPASTTPAAALRLPRIRLTDGVIH
ncbi:MAG: hypothetical protein AVDCRST_MAG17-393, partial [uncultured Solirubrobacterales bacterium]